MTGVLRASVAAAFLLALLAAGGCTSAPRCPPGASCPASEPRLTYVLTVNGHTVAPVKDGQAPRVEVRPGQQVLIEVAVTVPRNTRVEALWLGISSGPFGFTREHRPASLSPILARSRETLAAGPHTFTVEWRIPEHRPGPLLLMSDWSSSQPSAEVAGPIASLARVR